MNASAVPDGVPVLSRGKHHSPRRGACFMEFASFLDYWAPYVGKEGPVAEYVSALSADRQQKLKDAVERAYLDGERDGVRSYAATAWAVRGTAPE